MRRSAIEWTDFSGGPLNLVRRGRNDCEVSPGCANCYVKRIDARSRTGFLPDLTTTYPEQLARLRTMRFPSEGNKLGEGRRPMAFVCDTGDLFHDRVSRAFLDEVFQVLEYRTDVIWQILTKRPGRMQEFVGWWLGGGRELPGHIWLGVTAEDQQRADERIPILLEIPAVRFVSVEPMLGPVDLRRWLTGHWCPDPECGDSTWEHECLIGRLVDWVIAGGESGPGARPMHPDWVRAVRDQCQAAGVPFLFKQWGEWLSKPQVADPAPADDVFGRSWPVRPEWAGAVNGAPWGVLSHSGEWLPETTTWNGCQGDPRDDRELTMYHVGRARAGRLLDGRAWDEFPGQT